MPPGAHVPLPPTGWRALRNQSKITQSCGRAAAEERSLPEGTNQVFPKEGEAVCRVGFPPGVFNSFAAKSGARRGHELSKCRPQPGCTPGKEEPGGLETQMLSLPPFFM